LTAAPGRLLRCWGAQTAGSRLAGAGRTTGSRGGDDSGLECPSPDPADRRPSGRDAVRKNQQPRAARRAWMSAAGHRLPGVCAICWWWERGVPRLAAEVVVRRVEGLDPIWPRHRDGRAGGKHHRTRTCGLTGAVGEAARTARGPCRAQKLSVRIKLESKAVVAARRARRASCQVDDGDVINAKSVILATGAANNAALDRMRVRGRRRFYYAETQMEARPCRLARSPSWAAATPPAGGGS